MSVAIVWDLVGHQCLLRGCSAVDFSTSFTLGDKVLHFCRHARQIDTFTCTPQTRLYSKLGRVNLQLHICAKALKYHDGIPFENQPILYG